MKIKLKILLFLIFFFGGFGLGQNSWAGTCSSTTCSGSNPWTAASPEWNDVNHCVSVCAQPGDAVNIPPGTATWTQTFPFPDDRCADSVRGHWNEVGGLCINKGIRLLGSQIPGKPTTIINNLSGAGELIVYEPSYNSDEIFEIGYLNLDLNNKSPALFLGQYAHSAPFTPQTKIRIHHNHVYSSTTPTINIQFIEEMGGMYGLVDNNIIEDLCYPFRNAPNVMNATYWDSYHSIGWAYAPGDKYVLLHEDNIINLGTCSDRNDVNVLTDCQYSGRYAYRYNNIRTTQDASPLFDLHGNYYGMWACFGAEIYGNKLTLRNGKWSYVQMRDGQTMIFYNSNIGNVSYENECDSDQEPITYPAGQDMRESYWFNNRSGLTGVDQGTILSVSCQCPGHCTNPIADTNFWSYKDSQTFNGTSGVGCGTAETMNAIKICNDNVGFWIPNATIDPTAASCTNLEGYTGTNNALAASVKGNIGTLYKCISNTWTPFYTPLAYPHPVRTDCVNYPTLCDQDTNPPAAPSGLSVN